MTNQLATEDKWKFYGVHHLIGKALVTIVVVVALVVVVVEEAEEEKNNQP